MITASPWLSAFVTPGSAPIAVRSAPGSVARIVRNPTVALISVDGPSATTRTPRHEDDPVGVVVGLLEVVRREQHRLAAGGEVPHGRPEVTARFDVHRDGRLVQHEQVGVADDAEREAQPLGLAARQLVRAPVGQIGDPGELDDLVDRHRVRVQARDHRAAVRAR